MGRTGLTPKYSCTIIPYTFVMYKQVKKYEFSCRLPNAIQLKSRKCMGYSTLDTFSALCNFFVFYAIFVGISLFTRLRAVRGRHPLQLRVRFDKNRKSYSENGDICSPFCLCDNLLDTFFSSGHFVKTLC